MVTVDTSRPPASPLLIELKRLSDTDGPGLRDVVFFKGCPLRCSFCHNPESQTARAELAFHAARCIQCGRCAPACPDGAISLASKTRVNRSRCQLCGECAKVCPTSALRMVGSRRSVGDLQRELLRDAPYFRHSKGGVTLSGGECTQYLEFSGELAKALHDDHGLHVAIQTCGHFDWLAFETLLLPYVDLIFFDLKLACPIAHRQVTGESNALILSNLRRLLALVPTKVYPRIPLISQLTDTQRNLSELASILVSAGATTVSLLPYNPLGRPMYEALGRTLPDLPEHHYDPTQLARIHEDFQLLLADLVANSHLGGAQRSQSSGLVLRVVGQNGRTQS